MDKLKRYEIYDKRIGEDTVCLDGDVSALEADNERLKAEIDKLRKGIIEIIESTEMGAVWVMSSLIDLST